MFSSVILPFLVYWLVFFAMCGGLGAILQDQFYDEVLPYFYTRVAIGTAVFAVMATYFRPSFDTMFTNDIAWTLLQAIVWVAVFILLFQFHPWHGLAIAVVLLPISSGLASMGVDSLTKPKVATAPVNPRGSEPVRKSLNAPVAAPAK